MSYYTGTAANLSALMTAITNAAVANGWTWSGGVLSKGTAHFGIDVGTISTANNPYIGVLGKTAASGGVDAPNKVLIREHTTLTFTYPITYHLFVFDYDFSAVVNINPGHYFHLGFGQSQLLGFDGTGNYCYGAQDELASTTVSSQCPIPFNTISFANIGSRTYWCHTNINTSAPWYLSTATETSFNTIMTGWDDIKNMLDRQPNQYNQEAILLPVRLFQRYADSKHGLVFQAENMRYLRNDFIEDEEIIELGADRWMVFPGFQKNTSNRNYISTTGTYPYYNSGTYAVAYRYDGA